MGILEHFTGGRGSGRLSGRFFGVTWSLFGVSRSRRAIHGRFRGVLESLSVFQVHLRNFSGIYGGFNIVLASLPGVSESFKSVQKASGGFRVFYQRLRGPHGISRAF